MRFDNYHPFTDWAVAVPVSPGREDELEALLARYPTGDFCTYLDAGAVIGYIPNMDGPDTPLPPTSSALFVIQSGGKMWCGYNEFREHIAEAARFVAAAVFFVADENEYIDKYTLEDGKLGVDRVQSGQMPFLTDYLASHYRDNMNAFADG